MHLPTILAASLALMGCFAIADEKPSMHHKGQTPRDDSPVRNLRARLTDPRQRLIGSGKVCSCIVEPLWRDTVQVPDGWSIEACIDLCCGGDRNDTDQGIGAKTIEIGCMADTPEVMMLGITDATCGGEQMPRPPAGTVCGW